MDSADVVVVGGGISGAAFAYRSAAAGYRTLILEKEKQLGGCLDSRLHASGFWFELGAHTVYNSYGGFIELLEATRLMDRLLPRARVPFRVLADGEIRSIVSQLDFLEIVLSLPNVFKSRRSEVSVADYYSRLAGPHNYSRVVGPLLSAVPSQCADEFPSTMLFKKRPRRKDVPRSFTLSGGLRTLIDAISRSENIGVVPEVEVKSVEASRGFVMTGADGRQWSARALALAIPPSSVAALLQDSFPELVRAISRIRSVEVDSLGIVIPRAKLRIKPLAGIIPIQDDFFSAVSRDVVPDDYYRAFTFHFKSDLSRNRRLNRVISVLHVKPSDLELVIEKHRILPSPTLGHHEIVREVDRMIAGVKICLTGNYFAGLAIEDCVVRSNQEFSRLQPLI